MSDPTADTLRPPPPGADLAYELRELRLALMAHGEAMAASMAHMVALDRKLASILCVVERLERSLEAQEDRISVLEDAAQ